jgi:hypothetical protein
MRLLRAEQTINYMEQIKPPGFNGMALLFGPQYYAGYGNLKKGIILACVSALPITAFCVNVYCALKANRDLPVGKVAFNWKNAVIVGVLNSVLWVVVSSVIAGLKG